MTNKLPAIVLIGLAASTLDAAAGVTRHDRDSSDYARLAATFKSVGKVVNETGNARMIGSGTLIADQWVLTAGHNVDNASTLKFFIDGEPYEAVEWIIHPRWNGNLDAGFDLALVRLAKPVKQATPAPRYRGDQELGATATAVGFGRSGNGYHGDRESIGIKRAGQNIIDALGPSSDGRILLSDFDAPLEALGRGSVNRFGDNHAVDMEYLIAPGDSGGGLFIETSSGHVLAGVHSFSNSVDGTMDSSYGDVSGHIRVSAFNEWIDQVLSSHPAPEPSTAGIALAVLAGFTALGRRCRRYGSQPS